MSTKPADFIEKSTRDFESGVDVATVPQNQKPEDLLFGKPAPPTESEPQDEFFKWDEGKQEFYVEVPNGGRMERFTGKTRTEVSKNLAEGKANANQALAEKTATKPRTPDTKLPYDPIARKQPRQLSTQEIYAMNELRETDPVRAQEMAFEARTGYSFDAIAKSIELQESNQHELYAARVSSAFIGRHKDFLPNPSNMGLMDAFLKERKWPVTENNLEIAFYELQDKLQKPAPIAVVPPPQPQEFTPPPPPVSPPSRPAPNAKAAQGGLSREAVAAIQTGSLDEARAAIQTAFRQARGSR